MSETRIKGSPQMPPVVNPQSDLEEKKVSSEKQTPSTDSAQQSQESNQAVDIAKARLAENSFYVQYNPKEVKSDPKQAQYNPKEISIDKVKK
jgi:hypothetical protein